MSRVTGSSNFLGIANPTGALDITGTAVTVAAWVFPTSLTGRSTWAGKAAGDAGAINTTQYTLETSGSSLIAYVNGDTVTGGTLSTSVWRHIAMVKNGTGASALKAILDGSVTSGTSNASMTDGANDFRIGLNSQGAHPASGRVAEVAVWNVALTDAEVAALAKGASPLKVRPVGLAAYYPLWGVGEAGEPDLSGNGQHLTETGTVTVADHAPVGPYSL